MTDIREKENSDYFSLFFDAKWAFLRNPIYQKNNNLLAGKFFIMHTYYMDDLNCTIFFPINAV